MREGEATELAGAVGRLQRYAQMRDDKPLRQADDEIHCVHPGTEWEASIRLTDLRTVLTALATAQERVDLLDWLASKHRLSLYRYSPVYGDDDDQSVEWRVERESGGINDRGFEVVGRGDTPFEALSQARSMS